MRNSFKSFLSLLLTLSMIFSMVGVPIYAEDEIVEIDSGEGEIVVIEEVPEDDEDTEQELSDEETSEEVSEEELIVQVEEEVIETITSEAKLGVQAVDDEGTSVDPNALPFVLYSTDEEAWYDPAVDKYVIDSVEDMLAFAKAVNEDNITFADKTVTLGAEIDLADIDWTPIGNWNGTAFSGTFDGQGYAIRNLTIKKDDASGTVRLGLFGYIKNATIQNLTVDKANVSSTANVARGAVLVMCADGTSNTISGVTVSNSSVTMESVGQTYACGVVAWANSGTSMNMSNITVSGLTLGASQTENSAAYVAPVLGYHAQADNGTSTLEDFEVKNVTINVTSYQTYVGGAFGFISKGNKNAVGFGITNGTVDGLTIVSNATNASNVGGLIGMTYKVDPQKVDNVDITNVDITFSGSGSKVGGVTGWDQSVSLDNDTKQGWYNDVHVSGTIKENFTSSSASEVGGFVGVSHQYPTIYTNCSADVDIVAGNRVGGFVGTPCPNGWANSTDAYYNCTASGDVSGAYAGGFVGCAWLNASANSTLLLDGVTATGTVNGTVQAGGLIGSAWGQSNACSNIIIRNSVASDNVIAPQVGGVVGASSMGSGKTITLENVKWYFTPAVQPGNANVEIIDYVAQIGDTKYDSLAKAVTEANASEGGATVTLLKDVTLGEKLTISGDVTITGEYTITRDDAYADTLFAVDAGATLTLDGDLTIDGANEYVFDQKTYEEDLANWETHVPAENNTKYFTPEEGAPVATAYMITTSGTVNLNNVAIKNHYSTNGSGIVSASKGAVVTLDGAQITHNASTSGSGLVVNASAGVYSREEELITVTMNEGTVIDGNHVGGNHGIFKIYMGTYFTMNGGEVKNTTGWNSNGVVVGIYNAVFTMNGGTICSNSSLYGPNNGRNAAIYGHSNHLFTMNGGTICHNTGRSKAGIDSPYSEIGYTGQTFINGGTVVENTVIGTWTEPDVSGGATLAISGGTFGSDVTQWLAPDCGLVYDEETGKYTVTDHVYNLYFRDPATGEQVPGVGPLKSNDPASLVVTGKLFYADYYKMELEVLCDAKIDEPIVIDYPMTVNLNGKTITTAATAAGTYVDAFTILADVTVTGEGTVDARPSHGYAFYIGDKEGNAGKLTIENGTFYGETSVVNNRLGTVTINGGTYEVSLENEGDPYDYVLNCIDDNYKAGTASIVVKGGSFYKFDPADNAAEGAGTNFVAEGFKSEKDGDEYYIVREDKDALDPVVTITFDNSNTGTQMTLKYPSERYDTIQKLIGTNDYADFVLGAEQSELLAYIANGTASNIVMTLHDDIELDAPINFYNTYYQVPVEYAITIDGDEHTITWADGYTGTLFNIESGVSVTTKNLTIDGENVFTFCEEDTTDVEDGMNWYTRFVDVGEEDKAVNADVIVNAGELTLGEGTKIQNVTIASDGSDGKTENSATGGYVLKYNDNLAVIKSNGGTVTMNSAEIICNAGQMLNVINTVTEIQNSVISGNMGCGRNGGVIEVSGGTMTINAETSILNNKAMARSATILGVINGAEVTFAGTMDNNKHIGVGSNTAGAMVVLEGASQFVMNGGSISNNVGGRAGAIASRWVGGNYGQHEETSIVLNAGTITGNTATKADWNGASIFLRSPATIGEGMKIDGIIAVNAAPGELSITGGTINDTRDADKGLIVTDGLTAEITGGTFNYDPAEWVAEGYEAVNNGDGTWTVVEKAVAKIGEKTYPTLAKAIAAVTNGETIVLLIDNDENVTIKQTANLSFTIDGKKSDTENYTYTGTITVDGNTRSTGTETLTIKNVNFVAEASWQSSISAKEGTYVHNLTVEGCTFTGKDKQQYGIYLKHSYNITVKNTNGAKLFDLVYGNKAVTGFTAENVTVTDSVQGIVLSYVNSTATFKNVSITAEDVGVGILNNAKGTVTFEDCTINAGRPVYLKQNSTSTKEITLTFNGKNTLTSTVEDGALIVVDGTDAMFKVVVNDNSLDMTKTSGLVAKIGNVYYNTLQNAINDAEDNAEIVIVKDIDLANTKLGTLDGQYNTYFRVAGKTVTIDLDGHTISGEYANDSRLVGVFSTEDNGHLTLTGNGTVAVTTAVGSKTYALIVNYDTTSTMTIENGIYTLDKASDSLIYSDGKGACVNGGTFTLGNVGTGSNGSPWIFNASGANSGNYVYVTGGTYNADIAHQYYAFEVQIPNTHYARDNKDGTWTVCEGAVASVNIQIKSGNWYTYDTGYGSVYEAIEAAEANVANAEAAGVDSTVTILGTWTENVVYIPEDVTLDLNGNVLTATYVIGFNGSHLVDTSEENSGKLVASMNKVSLSETNKQLPVYIEGGYQFFEIELVTSLTKDTEADSAKMQFYVKHTGDWQKLAECLADNGTVDHDVSVMVKFTWITEEGNTASQYYSYSEEIVKNMAGFDSNDKYGVYNCTLTGIADRSDIRYYAVIGSGTDVEITFECK